MPAVTRAIKLLARTIIKQARQTPDFVSPRSLPPFHNLHDDGDDDDFDNDDVFGVDDDDIDIPDHFPFDADDDDHAGESLSPSVIAAIVISTILFLVVVIGLFAFFRHRRRQARKAAALEHEIAMKEEGTSVRVASASGARDPPPPYDEEHTGSTATTPARCPRTPRLEYSGQAWNSRGNVSRGEGEGDSDEIGSHATITDGLAPKRDDLGVVGPGGGVVITKGGGGGGSTEEVVITEKRV
jgi:hypothetical protein